MFVQGQDTHFRNVDYGFYMMLVLDASGRLFVDVGLHQTEEATAPIQTCRSNLVYAYTWQITGINTSTPVTLLQRWDNNATVHYSLSALDHNQTLLAQHVPSQPNCNTSYQNSTPETSSSTPSPSAKWSATISLASSATKSSTMSNGEYT
jgi:hypothetical protein